MLKNRSVLARNAEAAAFIAEGQEFQNRGYTMAGKVYGHQFIHIAEGYTWNDTDTTNALLKFYDDRPGHEIMCLKSYNTIIAALSLTDGSYWLSPENYSQTSGRHRGIFHQGIKEYRMSKFQKATDHQSDRGAHN